MCSAAGVSQQERSIIAPKRSTLTKLPAFIMILIIFDHVGEILFGAQIFVISPAKHPSPHLPIPISKGSPGPHDDEPDCIVSFDDIV